MTVLTSAFEHCLGSDVADIHPSNGNAYITTCVKEGGIKQHLHIYRVRLDNSFELVKVFRGGGDATAYAASQITQGGAKLRPDGSLLVSFSCIPKGDTSGRFKPVFEVVPNMDEPWMPS